MSVQVVVPGSFDPIHLGHVDVIERVARRVDGVVVAVLVNPGKRGLFTVDERMDLIRASLAHLGNTTVEAFEGLLVDFCRQRQIGVIAKGLRGVADFEYELRMAQMNTRIGDVETMFVPTGPDSSYLSSSLVKEVARFGGSIGGAVPEVVERAVRDRLAERA